MTFPESLLKDFDALESHPSGKILTGYHVRERRPGGRELLLRLLPDSFCRDKDLVESFHEFFTRFASISNKSYTPQVYSVTGAVNGPVYVLEEYVAGVSLKEFIKKKASSTDLDREVIEVLSKVCEALHHAHQKDIYHLFITPEDIIVDELTGGVKLVGFGAQIFVEKRLSGSVSPEVSNTMSPEILADKALEPSADVFSLARAIKTVCSKTLADSPVLSKALSDDSSQRYATARDFEGALNSVIDDVDTSTRPRTIYTPLEAKGGLKPVLTKKAITVERDLSDRQTRKIDTSPQPQINKDSVPPKSISIKLLAGIAVGLIAIIVGLALYVSHERQRLEKQLTEQKKQEETIRLKEIERQAAIYKEMQDRINRNEQDRLAKEAQAREIERLKAELEKKQREKEEQEKENARLKEAERQAAIEKEKQEQLKKRQQEQQDRLEQQKRQLAQQELERQERERVERERKEEQERQRRLEEKQKAFLQKLNQLVGSIEKGSDQARQEIGNLCRDAESMNMIRSAADNGNADAQFMLGRAYHLGVGVSTDYNLAIYWYTKSAGQQSAAAECNLGYIYHDGKGVPRDRSKARYWFTRAAQHGDTDAERMLRNKYGD